MQFDQIEQQLDNASYTVVTDDFPSDEWHGWKFIRFRYTLLYAPPPLLVRYQSVPVPSEGQLAGGRSPDTDSGGIGQYNPYPQYPPWYNLRLP